MADTIIQERYRLDFDATAATENIIALAIETDRLRTAVDKAKAGSKAFEKAVVDLARSEEQLMNVLAQEVSTYNAIVAKRKIAQLALETLSKGTAVYNRVLSEVQALEKREINTLDGLSAKRGELQKQLGQLEIGTKKYRSTLKELQGVESKAAKEAGNISKQSGSFTQALRGGLAAIGISVGINEVIEFGKESFKLAAEKQQQKNALLTSLNSQVDVQERLLKQADQIEAVTLVDDDDIIALDRYLASLGLSEKQIRKLNDASVQLAAVQGTTVRSAADKLLAAQNGQIRALAKLVPEVKGLSKAQLAAGEAADIVSKKFAGSAEALATGVVGLQNRLKDITEGFKEASGDAITRGFAKNVAAFTNLFGGADGSATLERFSTALTGTIEDIISIPAYAIAGVKAVFAGIGAGFDYIKNRARIVVLDAKESFYEAQKFFGLQKQGDLQAIADIQRARQVLQERNENGFFGSISDAAKRAFDDALKGTDELAQGMKSVKKEGDDKNTGYFPKLKSDAKAVKGSLSELGEQLSKLREKLTKFTVADDKKALEPLLIQIEQLEKRIRDAKKLQDDLLTKPFAEFKELPTKDVQAAQIAIEQQRARIQEQAIKEESANRLRAIEEEQTAALDSTAITATQREKIEAKFQAQRQQLAIETDREITANAIRQKQLELAELERTASKTKNGDPEGIAKLQAELAALQAQLAAIQNKEVNVKIDIDKDKKAKNDLKEIADAAINLAQQVAGALQSIFDRQAERAGAAVDRQKSKLSEALANSEEFTAQQIEIERDRLDQFQKEQERAAKRAKALQVTQVIANTIIAIAKAAGQTGVGAPIAIISTLAAIAAGIAAASSLADNSFYGGTDFVPLGNNPKGKDTIPARLHEGEGVLQADKNKAYSPTFKAMRRGQIPADVLNGFVESWKGGSQMNMPRTRRLGLPESVSGSNVGGNQNFYFNAKLNTLEREAATQTNLLKRIEMNGRGNTSRQIKKSATTPGRFV